MPILAKPLDTNACLETLSSINNALGQVVEEFTPEASQDKEKLRGFQQKLKSLHKASNNLDKGIWKRYYTLFLPIQALMKPKSRMEGYKEMKLEKMSTEEKDLLQGLFKFFDQFFSLKTALTQNFPENEIPKEVRYINTEINKLGMQARATLAKFGFGIRDSKVQPYKDTANQIIDESDLQNKDAIRRDLKLGDSEYSKIIKAVEGPGKELVRRSMPWLTTVASEAVFVKAETWYNSSLEKAIRDFEMKVIGTGKNRLDISDEDAQKMIYDFALTLFAATKLLQAFCVLGIAGMNQATGKKFFNEASTIHRRDALKRIRNAAVCSAGMYTICSKSLNSMGNNNVYRINMPGFGETVYKSIMEQTGDPKKDVEVTDEKVLAELKKRCDEHCTAIVSDTIMTTFRHGAAVSSGVTGFYNPDLIENAIDFTLKLLRK